MKNESNRAAVERRTEQAPAEFRKWFLSSGYSVRHLTVARWAWFRAMQRASELGRTDANARFSWNINNES